jgi:hypothetical protein
MSYLVGAGILLGAYGSESMSYEGVVSFALTGTWDGKAYGKVSRDLLRWHIRPLLNVRHFDAPIAVSIAVQGSCEVCFFNVVAELAEWR